MLESTNADYVKLANELILISNQVYAIMTFFLLVLVIYLVYRLFNSFF